MTNLVTGGAGFIGAEDVRIVTRMALDALPRVPETLWDIESDGMEWTRDYTLRHMIQAFTYYSYLLANRDRISSTPPSLRISDPELTTDDLLTLLPIMSEVLISVADSAPSDARGWHNWGSPDTEGYLAMGCNEILLHAYDITHDLDFPIVPAEDICDRMLRRLYPWTPTETPRWPTLRWVTGRGELDGHNPITSWQPYVAPLTRWDGEILAR